jgi:hypothetical protein
MMSSTSRQNPHSNSQNHPSNVQPIMPSRTHHCLSADTATSISQQLSALELASLLKEVPVLDDAAFATLIQTIVGDPLKKRVLSALLFGN